MGQLRIAKKPHLMRDTLIAAAVLSSLASSVRAQTKGEFYGPPSPLVFDAQGARHWCLYGYSGPFTPPLIPNDTSVVSCRGNAGTQPTTMLKRQARKNDRTEIKNRISPRLIAPVEVMRVTKRDAWTSNVNAGKSQQIFHKGRLIGSGAVRQSAGRGYGKESRRTDSEIFAALFRFITL
jgi:hypothetical protein